jgi:hypothetical protein
VPENGKWDETDKPLLITFDGTEELVTKGSGNELVYQFMDKYMDTFTRYFDSKTGQIVEGRSSVSDVEIVENEVIKGSVVCVTKEYCMNGQMEVDQEVAKVFYEKFLDALLNSKVNEEYFNNLLNGDVSLGTFKNYLEANNGMVPAGIKMMRHGEGFQAVMDRLLEKPINLSAIKTVTFGSKEWQNDVGGIQEYLQNYDGGLINVFSDTEYVWNYLGWIVDENGYLVIVNGTKDPEIYENVVCIGGKNGEYVAERDNRAATGYALSLVTFMEKYDDRPRAIVPFAPDNFNGLAALDDDIQRLLGGKYLFKSSE